MTRKRFVTATLRTLAKFGGMTYKRDSVAARVAMPQGYINIDTHRRGVTINVFPWSLGEPRVSRNLYNTTLYLAIVATTRREVRAGSVSVVRLPRVDDGTWAYYAAGRALVGIDAAMCDAAFDGDAVALAMLTDRLIDANP